MKKFQFSLEKVLTYKDQNLESELANLSELYHQLHQIEEKLIGLQQKYERCVQDYENAKRNTTPATCKLYLNYLDLLTNTIKECEQERNEFLIKINYQIELIKKLKVETKSLETIKESRFELYKKEMVKKTERQVEEFVSTASLISKSF